MKVGSSEFLIERVEADSDIEASEKTNISTMRNLMYSEKPLKFFACIFYGLCPCYASRHQTKLRYAYLSLALATLQWFSISMYIYCIKTYWTAGSGPHIPTETMVVMVALNTSTAVSFTFTVLYFYQRSNNFKVLHKMQNSRGFSITPYIPFQNQDKKEKIISLSEADWLLVNVLCILGFIAVAGVFIGAFAFDAFMDFLGIHKFTEKISGLPLVFYLCAVSIVYWGFCATICTCCIFHTNARNIINHIDYTEDVLLNTNSKADFLSMHQALLRYTEQMMMSLRYWFAFHNVFFAFLILATIFEWINAVKRSEEKQNADYRIWFAQLAGSSLISYKFAFPFISASRVTARYNLFYYNIARRSKLSDLPDLALLRENSGYKLFGFRITTSVALITILSSFIGALKFIADFNTK